MSHINIRRRHDLPLADARKAAEKVAKQLEKDFDLQYEWRGHVLEFARSGVDGELHVTEQEVRVEARLGLLLGFLKPRIEAEVEKNLDRLFDTPVAKARPRTAAKTPAKKAPAKRR